MTSTRPLPSFLRFLTWIFLVVGVLNLITQGMALAGLLEHPVRWSKVAFAFFFIMGFFELRQRKRSGIDSLLIPLLIPIGYVIYAGLKGELFANPSSWYFWPAMALLAASAGYLLHVRKTFPWDAAEDQRFDENETSIHQAPDTPAPTNDTMDTYFHITEFAGLPVQDLAIDENPAWDHAIRIGCDWDELDVDGEAFNKKLDALLAAPGIEKIQGLVLGMWTNLDKGDDKPAMAKLEGAAAGLSNLRHVFIGDLMQEECEISWITQGSHAEFITRLPVIETYVVRGSQELSFEGLHSKTLKSLTIQCGGLPSAVIRQVLAADLPDLEVLELWLGDENYGWDGDLETLRPLLGGDIFPKLRSLGLRNSEITDEIAIALSDAPILDRISHLDLSMGTLKDEGAEALLRNPKILFLESMNLDHHYMSTEIEARFDDLSIEVSHDDKQDADTDDDETHYYVEVSE